MIPLPMGTKTRRHLSVWPLTTHDCDTGTLERSHLEQSRFSTGNKVLKLSLPLPGAETRSVEHRYDGWWQGGL